MKRQNLENLIGKSKDKTILVAAAGNFHPEGSRMAHDPVLSDVITVGSANYQGFVSSFSNESPDVTILAPSDSYQLSDDENGDRRFGGTSGATPLVSGALSNALNFIPLSAAEAKTLVVRTATKIPAVTLTSKNGAGLINAYRLVRVAARLKEKGWLVNKPSLQDISLYDFSVEAEGDLKKAKALLAKNSVSCADTQQAEKLLRKSFLLNENSEAASLLAMVKAHSNNPLDSAFYSHRTEQDVKSTVLRVAINIKNLLKSRGPLESATFTDNESSMRMLNSMYQINDVSQTARKSSYRNFTGNTSRGMQGGYGLGAVGLSSYTGYISGK